MTDAARAAARAAIAAKRAGSGQKIEEDRLWANLLSSQPLAFNLFADLGRDLDTATRVFRRLWPERVSRVRSIAFEYSPGRGDAMYTADKSAFDVYVEHSTPGGGDGFIGIEVKYHEGLTDPPAKHRARYDEVTSAMQCFRLEEVAKLRQPPIEQIWRDHMLAGSMLLADGSCWETGLYVFLHAADNHACRAAVELCRSCLRDSRTFDSITLEAVVDAIEGKTTPPGSKRSGVDT